MAVLFAGLVLGLVGGGGSILTVPILVYLFGVGPGRATGYSLFVVGVTSLAGSVVYWIRKQVVLRAAAWFAIPSLLMVYVVRRYLLPKFPHSIVLPFAVALSVDWLLMLLFAFIMIVAAVAMIRPQSAPARTVPLHASPQKLVTQGLLVGFLAGLLGAGGGFLIVPALVFFAGLSMPVAIGTSLAIIAAQSFFGFLGVLQVQNEIDWLLLEKITALALGGMVAGLWISRKTPAKHLKAIFGWLVLAVGAGMLVQELSR